MPADSAPAGPTGREAGRRVAAGRFLSCMMRHPTNTLHTGATEMRIYKPRRRKTRLLRHADGTRERVDVLDRYGLPIYVESAKWYIECRDPRTGKPVRRAGFVDEAATWAKANRLQEDLDRQAAGLRPESFERERRGMGDHVAAFRRALDAKGNSARHVTKTISRLSAVAGGCGWRHADAIALDPVMAYLADRRAGKAGLSLGTCNGYLRAVRAFSKWLLRTGRIRRDPLAGLRLFNTAPDRRTVRRALSDDELRTLFEATEKSAAVRQGMPGPARALLYRLAVATGFRANELRHVRPADFDLDGDPPTVAVAASYSKRRRVDVQTLPAWIVPRLRPWLDARPSDDAEPLLRVPRDTGRMIKADLEAASIPLADGQGRVADFHALRVTAGTRLALAGVPMKIAQDLLRHSDPKLTFGIYAHTDLAQRAAALEAVPDPEAPPTRRRRRRKKRSK